MTRWDHAGAGLRTGRTIIAAALAVLALSVLIVWQIQHALPGPALWDFGSFMGSGRAAAEGGNPYAVYPGLTFRLRTEGFEGWNLNLNPPVSLLLFDPLSRLDPTAAFRWWWGTTLLVYAGTVWLVVARYSPDRPLLPALAAFAAAGFWDTLVLGQIYVPLALAAVVAWLLLERGRWLAAGLLIGLVVAVKPNFLVWPGLLFLAGHRRVAAAAGGSAALLSLAPALLYGPDVYGQWVEMLARNGAWGVFLTNASLPGLFQRVGLDGLGTAAALGLMAALAAWALWRRPDPLRASAFGLLGSLLASPLAWVHYTLFLLPLFLRRRPTPPVVAAAALLIVPVPVLLGRFMGAPDWVQATAGSAYAWALLLLLYDLVDEGRSPGTAQATSRRAPTAQAAE